MGNRKRQRYLSYLVFDQQKIRYYGVFDATYPLNDAELRLKRLLYISFMFHPFCLKHIAATTPIIANINSKPGVGVGVTGEGKGIRIAWRKTQGVRGSFLSFSINFYPRFLYESVFH